MPTSSYQYGGGEGGGGGRRGTMEMPTSSFQYSGSGEGEGGEKEENVAEIHSPLLPPPGGRVVSANYDNLDEIL